MGGGQCRGDCTRGGHGLSSDENDRRGRGDRRLRSLIDGELTCRLRDSRGEGMGCLASLAEASWAAVTALSASMSSRRSP